MFTNRLFHILFVAIIVVTGCAPQIAPTSAPASVPVATAAQEEPTSLRLAVSDGEDDPDAPYALEFVQQVKTLSNGNITIEPVWHAGDDVGDTYETGVIQHVREGTFDLGLTPSRAWDTDNVTSFQALQAPFLIDNDALAVAIAKSDIATRMLDSLSATGVTGLTLWPEDLRHPFSPLPDNPILSPEDLAGLNFRVPISKTSNTLFASLGAEPMMADSGYDAGESGLLQGAYLSGIPTFTANVTFFAKYQTLFANSAAFEKLSEEQRAVLRQAAAAAQKKAVAEHTGDVQAGTAWCADGGSIVLASEEQLAAFEKAAQPVFDSIKQDPFNAERIAEISELKAKTEASAGASACAPDVAQASPEPGTDTQVWSAGLPPNGVWQVELGVEDFARMGVSQAKAEKWGLGLYTWTFTDGKAQLDWKGKATTPPYESYTCWYDYLVDGDSVRFTGTSSDPSGTCDGSIENSQWRLDEQGLHLHLVSAKDGDSQEALRAIYEAKPWQKVEAWSEGLPPNGVWQVELSEEDIVGLGVLQSKAPQWVGKWTWTFKDGKAVVRAEVDVNFECKATYNVVEDFVRFTYDGNEYCSKEEVDDIQWRLDQDGLHLHLVAIKNAPFAENKAMYEAKPWQKIADQ